MLRPPQAWCDQYWCAGRSGSMQQGFCWKIFFLWFGYSAPFSTHFIVFLSHSTSCGSERRAPPCTADELDISQSLLKALESESDSSPWPSLHVNMDNKVRHFSPHAVVPFCSQLRCCPNVFIFLLFPCQGEEKQLSEKSLHPPSSPAMLPDHLKCNILKAQMEAAFRVSTKVHSHLSI